jgi:hypothetical protein
MWEEIGHEVPRVQAIRVRLQVQVVSAATIPVHLGDMIAAMCSYGIRELGLARGAGVLLLSPKRLWVLKSCDGWPGVLYCRFCGEVAGEFWWLSTSMMGSLRGALAVLPKFAGSFAFFPKVDGL